MRNNSTTLPDVLDALGILLSNRLNLDALPSFDSMLVPAQDGLETRQIRVILPDGRSAQFDYAAIIDMNAMEAVEMIVNRLGESHGHEGRGHSGSA